MLILRPDLILPAFVRSASRVDLPEVPFLTLPHPRTNGHFNNPRNASDDEKITVTLGK